MPCLAPLIRLILWQFRKHLSGLRVTTFASLSDNQGSSLLRSISALRWPSIHSVLMSGKSHQHTLWQGVKHATGPRIASSLGCLTITYLKGDRKAQVFLATVYKRGDRHLRGAALPLSNPLRAGSPWQKQRRPAGG